ncbi:choice-of-anchor I family protein [Sabulibacter ruber]|uniref:choice-of-anchor I family protein n=1 Tax=Sabulibacter ruber TaxID=2811901 RepID=UPI001A966806|nr:choice-of-anchor I family protein [Sabulibacter ruber]
MMKKLLLLLVQLVLLVQAAMSQTLVHYWNFNTSTSVQTLLQPSSSIVTGAGLEYVASATSELPITGNTTGQGFEAANLNARNNDPAGAHLRFNNPIGGALVFQVPTTGYQNVVMKYATRRSGSGAGTQVVEYSTDGTTYVPFTTIAPVDGNPTLQTLDFTSIASVNNNANFKVRISFEQGGGGTVGNNRLDNVTLEGNPLGTDNVAPTVVFNPATGAQQVPVVVQPTLTFNEDVRLVNNATLTNENVAALVELRKDNAAGAPVAFEATVSGRTITMVPTQSLQNNQTYFVALKANVVEDLSDNALPAVQSATFTTIAVQTVFQPGDLVPVAYRMNATSTDDEIALITLVNILPGTMIHFTDAKYTTNAQPQCPGGFTWTAPPAGVAAGTVLRIQNDALTTNLGTLSGSGFGLSSSGDQVLVYTGTPQNPAYITALSSNVWVSANTSCSGSNSMLPAGLTDGATSINLSTAAGNVSGNTVNAYYNGPQTGSKAQLQQAILNPANWVGTASGTAAQTWPTWAFPGPPSVVTAKTVSNTTIALEFSRELNAASATQLSHYTGIAGLQSATLGSNGKTVTLTYSAPFTSGASYSLVVSGVQDTENQPMFSAYTYAFTYNTTISLASNFLTVNENAGSVQIRMNLVNPASGSVQLVLKQAPFSTAGAADITYTTQTLTFTGSSPAEQVVTIPVIDDNEAEQDEYFVLSLENATGLTITGNASITVYLKDNDRLAPQPTREISLNHVGSFKPVASGSTTEIVVHDPATQRLYMTSAVQDRLDIADFSNPAAIQLIKSVDMKPYGGITSVAVKNGMVAVASPNASEHLNGSVVFFNTNGEFQKQVTVGALPDMITFTPDGTKVLTANEGQPNADYSIDPEGSITIIDVSGGLANLTQANVTTLLFDGFNSQEATLKAAGVRKTKASSTLSQDLEPEYITVSEDSRRAWVTLQENNAFAEINLENASVTSIWAMGTKDMSALGNGFDASDNNNQVLLSNWPIKAFYTPDAVASYNVGGVTYLVTANEGDEKEYTGLVERTTVGAVTLDPTVFPNAAILQQNNNLGRLRITNLHGDTDGDGDYDELYMLGSRSFSIWNSTSKALVYDSGDDFERITSTDPSIAPLFNADNESNGVKSRSRAKGPEPEGVTVAAIEGKNYAFIGLERVGGVMVYNITNPAQPVFVDYRNSRSLTAYAGDQGPEGIFFIPNTASPNGRPYVLVANELSGSVAVYQVMGTLTASKEELEKENDFTLFPNPANGGKVSFSQKVTIDVLDATGRKIYAGKNVQSLDVSHYKKGLYFVKTSQGQVRRLVVN